ncbi:cysteine-rich receptor-like protein kinase 10 [Populus nigra]|uniref:cysteine-rich receptor-like protein kinase 10 n=1 Tax=Populus nigra TaxID=3691 RepID=UPI002B272B55|nr:cysteine-rich receptor-like protein kinase 10 [Populus nigra]XP_061978206.1 cysteine-rich receptor-like protein kinase 10 [Populus nigra]
MGHNFLLVKKSFQMLLLYFSIANLLDLAYADPPYRLCSNKSSYTDNSPFQNNLVTLMASLSSNASVSKNFNTSTGIDPDRVYAQYMCLNYVTNESCRTCVAAASQDIRQLCPGDKEAVVWGELCQLRYSNQRFLGHLDVSGNIPQFNPKNISNPEHLSFVVNKTLSSLIKKAAFDSSANMYATRDEPFTDSDSFFSLVQCSTDLSPNDCYRCVEVAIKNVTTCCYFSRGARVLSRSCYLRYELYAFYDGASESSQSLVTGKGNESKIWIITISTVASTLLVVAILGSFFCHLAMKFRKRKCKKENTSQDSKFRGFDHPNRNDFQHQDFQRDGLNDRESAIMDLASINAATDNFSEANFLGQGGFGPVYKGILSDGKELAVKRLSALSEQGKNEFTNEVLLIMKLQHKNLVKLLGFCVDGGEKLLVYEFMPNNSLDMVLFDPRKGDQLSWRSRIHIINGIAKGTLYLHEDSRLRIIHRDLKASNILLDNNMNPKISDFGMARIMEANEGEANTVRIVGTYGYMAPEYAMEGHYSTKSDVFSFGVILLEIITGRKNSGFHKSKRAPSLLAYAWELWNNGKELEMIDPVLADSCCSDEFSRCVRIGLLCVQEDASERPAMSSVVLMLKSDNSIDLPQPQRPAIFAGRFTDHHEAKANDCSVNGLTVSDILPR